MVDLIPEGENLLLLELLGHLPLPGLVQDREGNILACSPGFSAILRVLGEQDGRFQEDCLPPAMRDHLISRELNLPGRPALTLTCLESFPTTRSSRTPAQQLARPALTPGLVLISGSGEIVWSTSAGAAPGNPAGGEGSTCHSLCLHTPPPCEHCPIRISLDHNQPSSMVIRGDRGTDVVVNTLPLEIDNEIRGVLVTIDSLEAATPSPVTEPTMELRLRHNQRMEAIGTLASGVAHDINNPLSIIMNSADLIMEDSPEDSEIHQHADFIMTAGSRIATTIKNLMTFAHSDQIRRGSADLGTAVEKTLSLIGKLISRAGIRFVFKAEGKEFPRIRCEERALQHVLMNLLHNSVEAITGWQSRPSSRSPEIWLQAELVNRESETWLRIELGDNGPGMSRDVAMRAFDPFFSTKPKDLASGLGLSVTHGIIKETGGIIHLSSEVGEGTIIHIELPTMAPDTGNNPGSPRS